MPRPDDAYQVIAEMWTFPESDSFRKMLEALMTPEEAEFVLEARSPITAADLAKKLNADEKETTDKLDNLAKRGLIFRGKTEYHFKRGLHFGFAGPPLGLPLPFAFGFLALGFLACFFFGSEGVRTRGSSPASLCEAEVHCRSLCRSHCRSSANCAG